MSIFNSVEHADLANEIYALFILKMNGYGTRFMEDAIRDKFAPWSPVICVRHQFKFQWLDRTYHEDKTYERFCGDGFIGDIQNGFATYDSTNSYRSNYHPRKIQITVIHERQAAQL